MVWLCSRGAVLPSSPGEGLVTAQWVAGLRSRGGLEREAGLGWDLSAERSSGDGLSLSGAVGAKSIVPFPQVGLLQGLPPTCPCLPERSLHVPSAAPGFSPASFSQPAWRGDAPWDGVDGDTCSAPCHPHHKPWHGSRAPGCFPTCL